MKRYKIFTLLATLFLLLAACGGADSAPEPKEVVFEGPNELKFVPDHATGNVGQELNITLKNTGALEHNFVWDDTGEEVIATKAGEEASTTRTFDTAGEYGFHCTVPGHKEAGMVGKVVVE